MLSENLESDLAEPTIAFKIGLNPRLQKIHQEALLRAKNYLIAEAELLEIIIEVDRNRVYENFALTHLTPYCVKYLGLSDEVAANFVRVARKSLQVPELKEAVDEGRLSVTKAKVIASVITSENHNIWIDKAENMSKYNLEREIAEAYPQAKKSEKAQIKGPDRVRVEFELSHEMMELFRKAQDLVSQKLQRSASLAETQAELLKVFIETRDPVRKAERAKKRKLKVEFRKESQKGSRSRDRSRAGGVRSDERQKLKAEVIHEVHLRDQGICQAQLPDGSTCGQGRWVHLHHIQPKSEGGVDTAENLITLCSAHHRIWHRPSH